MNRLVREALAADEHAIPLAPALKEAQSKAVRLLTQKTAPPPEKKVPPPLPPKVGKPSVCQGQKADLSLAEARRQLELLEQEARDGRAVTVSLAWQITEGGDQA